MAESHFPLQGHTGERVSTRTPVLGLTGPKPRRERWNTPFRYRRDAFALRSPCSFRSFCVFIFIFYFFLVSRGRDTKWICDRSDRTGPAVCTGLPRDEFSVSNLLAQDTSGAPPGAATVAGAGGGERLDSSTPTSRCGFTCGLPACLCFGESTPRFSSGILGSAHARVGMLRMHCCCTRRSRQV